MTINHSEIDYWFYTIGANVIPVDSKNKEPTKEWKIWQDKPIPNESFEQRKKQGRYNNGIAIITGKIWRGTYKGKYLVCVDIDNKKGKDEFLSYFPESKTLEKLAEKTIVEQHLDNREKAHIYFIVEKPLTKKSGIKGTKNDNNEVPAIEVKSEGGHGIMFCTPSIHKEGQPYQIIGTKTPAVLDKEQSEHLEDAINKIYNKYEGNSKKNKENRIPIENLFKGDYKVTEGNNRHEDLLRVMESYIIRNRKILAEEEIKKWAHVWNQEHCKPPLDDKEFEKQWTCATKFVEKKNTNETEEGKEGKEKRAEDVSNILNDIKERYLEIFKDQLNKLYVTIKINDHVECIPIESERFKNIIRKEYFEKEHKLLNDDKLHGILQLIEADNDYNANIKTTKLNLRVAQKNDTFFYDLANQKWELVKITSDGWEIVKNNEIPLFKRYENNSKAQVYPSTSTDDQINKEGFNQFLKLFNLRNSKDLLLLSVYIISLFVPEIPKVILVVSGNGGGAKTTTFRLVKDIVDPSSVDILSFNKNTNDLIQILEHHYVNFFDNVSSVSLELSDLLCRAVTGSGYLKRALYTDDSDVSYNFKRCIGINGINIVTTRADLVDRSLSLRVERIPEDKRKKEEEIKKEFERVKPFVLAYIFDTLVKVLKYREGHQGEKLLRGSPRMADFAEWGEIISRCLGNKDNEFIDAYQENIDNQNDEIIESTPVAESIILFMDDKERWEGTPSQLYKFLEDIISQVYYDLRRSNLWPKAANRLTAKINEITPNLLKRNIEIVTGDKNSEGNRVIKIRKLNNDTNNSSLEKDKNHDDNSGHHPDIPFININIHRIGRLDTFECDKCPKTGDIHFMKQHFCKGN